MFCTVIGEWCELLFGQAKSQGASLVLCKHIASGLGSANQININKSVAIVIASHLRL